MRTPARGACILHAMCCSATRAVDAYPRLFQNDQQVAAQARNVHTVFPMVVNIFCAIGACASDQRQTDI
jgi:hypothetical protein